MTKKKRKTKQMGKIYHNKTVVDGIKFDSQTESEYYTYITTNKNKLNIKSIELQPSFILQPKYILTPEGKKFVYEDDKSFKSLQRQYPNCTKAAIKYIADFKITYNDGRVEVIDVKGIKTADFKLKEKMFNFMYPEYHGLICVAKYKNEWLHWDEYQQRKKKK